MVFSDSGEYHWYIASTGTTANAFSDVEENSTDTSDPGGGGSGVGDWYLLTRTGYDLSGNAELNGNLAVYRTNTISKGGSSEINGNLIVDTNGLISPHTLNELKGDVSSGYTATQTNIELPVCQCSSLVWLTHKDIQIKENKKEIHIKANAEINGPICVPEGYDLHINAKVRIIGDIIATNSPSIFINGGATIKGGICAPESQFDVSGNAEIDGPVYVNFLWMRGTASLGK